jgi:hypothetical protein
MAVQALVAGAAVAVVAFFVALGASGTNAAISALLGAVAVAGSFALYVIALGRARLVSPAAVQLVAMFGWLLRLGVIVGLLFGLRAAAGWFNARAFGLTAIAAALAVAIFEARAWLAEGRAIAETPSQTSSSVRGEPRVGSGA